MESQTMAILRQRWIPAAAILHGWEWQPGAVPAYLSGSGENASLEVTK